MEPTMEEKLNACIRLCEEGDPEMCAFLGGEFYYGMNVPQDLDRAKRYLAVAAEHGHAVSQFTLGFMYWTGRGTERDLDEALRLFLLAAEQGIPEAMYDVACILLTKDEEKNKDEAIRWLTRSANAGYGSAHDMLSDLEDERRGVLSALVSASSISLSRRRPSIHRPFPVPTLGPRFPGNIVSSCLSRFGELTNASSGGERRFRIDPPIQEP